MSDDNQLFVPPSFIALYVAPNRIKPSIGRDELVRRYEFCEDLATLLTEHANNQLFDLGIAETDVLERCHAGLLVEGSGVDAHEAGWVIRRLAELLRWPCRRR
ncbi:MAG: ATPase with chaperone activity [Burkholderiaceae bacterium]